MSLWRMLCIAPSSAKKRVETALRKNLEIKNIEENDKAVLIAASGRVLPSFPSGNVLVLGVDGRNTGYYCEGPSEIGESFNTKIELTVGFEIKLSDLTKVNRNKDFKKSINMLKEIYGDYSLEQKSLDCYGLRLDLTPNDESSKAMTALKTLCGVFNESEIPYRVAYFDGRDGMLEGDLDQISEYIGPSAYALASWEAEDGEMNLIVNESEVLFDGIDGGSVDFDEVDDGLKADVKKSCKKKKSEPLGDQLLDAVYKGDGSKLDVVMSLIEKGADVNWQSGKKDRKGVTPLLAASIMFSIPFRCNGDFIEVIKFLINKGADVNAVDEHGSTALMLVCRAASWAPDESVEIAKLLVDKGADVNAVGESGGTTLFWGCRSNCYEIVKFLVQKGADVSAKDNEGETALEHVVRDDDDGSKLKKFLKGQMAKSKK